MNTHLRISFLSAIAPTYSEPLGVIRLPGRKQRLEGVVGRKREAGSVDQELAGDVEEDEEEVEGAEAEDNVDLGHTRLGFQFVEVVVLAELPARFTLVYRDCERAKP